ncbi:hypothetical protein GMMP15_730060 [Candidatus Magnetomoraceae bacterium gMMP-15]
MDTDMLYIELNKGISTELEIIELDENNNGNIWEVRVDFQ